MTDMAETNRWTLLVHEVKLKTKNINKQPSNELKMIDNVL